MTAARATSRLVLVDEPERLVRDALIAAINATPGLSAVDGSTAGPSTVGRADAAVVASDTLDSGWRRLLADGHWDDGPAPVIVVADDGPVIPVAHDQGVVVASRATPLAAIVDHLLGARPVPRHGPRPRVRPLLTEREHEVLGLLATGLNPTEVARQLAITTYTARDHIKAIREKLDRPTAMAAVLEALRRGLVQLDRA
jgi:DNA-binding CsgD family transcriptional regulator